MTGQILGGSPVTEAARYQVLIIWLIGTINFSSVFMNTYMVYKVAFDTSKHMLRTERFIEVVRKKRKGLGVKRIMETLRSACLLLMSCGRDSQTSVPQEGYVDVEQQPLSSLDDYGTGKKCNIEIQTRNQGVGVAKNTLPLLQLSQLQYSVPKSHSKQSSSLKPSVSSSSLPAMSEDKKQRILCRGLDVTLHKGEIGIVRGKSGSGKSTLLRVIAGLAPMDEGNVTADGLSLSNCEMTHWRSMVRYVTQYKVDIPGSKYIEFFAYLIMLFLDKYLIVLSF
jgi:ABC-type multidrug transport system fused ATPase/permease subunit